MKKTSILTIVLFLAGCVGTSSPSHFYQLQMTDARVEPVSSRRLDVGVEEAFVPKYLDRPQIVTVEAGSSELKMSEFYRWAEPLSSSFSRVLADDLSLYLPKSVVKYKTLSSENFTFGNLPRSSVSLVKIVFLDKLRRTSQDVRLSLSKFHIPAI